MQKSHFLLFEKLKNTGSASSGWKTNSISLDQGCQELVAEQGQTLF